MGTNAIRAWKAPKKNLKLGSLKDDKAVGMKNMPLNGVKNKSSLQTYGPGASKKMGLI